jgi:hypothetical protein
MNFDQFTLSEINDKDRQLVSSYTLCLVPSKYQLVDPRIPTEFKTHTLGGFPKAKVAGALDKALAVNKIEAACYWAFQLMASGMANAVWEKLLAILFKSVNIASPRLPAWIQGKQVAWLRTVIRKELSGPGVLQIRNIQTARNLITEVIVVICQSRRRKLDVCTAKIRDSDFVIGNVHERCQARGSNMISGLLGDNDPSEIRLAANEFCFNLVNKNMQGTLYWLNWILYWERINIKKFKQPFIIQAREVDGIPYNETRDVIWLLWSIVHQVRTRVVRDYRGQMHPAKEIDLLEAQLDSLWKTYIFKWKSGAKSKRLPLLIWSLHYLIYPIDWTIEVIPRLDTYVKAVANVNLMFEKMKTQCRQSSQGPYASSGGSLFDSMKPTLLTTSARIMDNIGSNNGLTIIIEDHFKADPGSSQPTGPIISDDKRSEGKRAIDKKNVGHIQSIEKMEIMQKLDRYLTT